MRWTLKRVFREQMTKESEEIKESAVMVDLPSIEEINAWTSSQIRIHMHGLVG